MGNELLGETVAAHDEELEGLRTLVKSMADLQTMHDEQLEALAEAVGSLHEAVERMFVMVGRHEATLSAMHRGLHRTTDPQRPSTH